MRWDCDTETYLLPSLERPFADSRLVVSGTSRLFDFPLFNPAPNPYTDSAAIIARLGGELSLIEATDDQGTGDAPTYNAQLANIIAIMSVEVNSHLGTIYPIPFRRRGTVATWRVTSVDSNGAITGLEARTTPQDGVNVGLQGYYQIAPVATNNALAVAEGPGVGATVSVTFSSGAPFSVSSAATITAGGSKYRVGDVVGLTGGASYVPDKVKAATTALCCHALYQRRVAPGEMNLFADDAKLWRGTPRYPGILVQIGKGEVPLDDNFPRSFSPGAAWVERNRLDVNTL